MKDHLDKENIMLTHEEAIRVGMEFAGLTYEEAEKKIIDAIESGELPVHAIN